MFFAWRLYIIAQNLFVPGRIGFVHSFTSIQMDCALTWTVLARSLQLGAGIWTGVIIAQVHKFSPLEYRLVKPPRCVVHVSAPPVVIFFFLTEAWLAATAVTDLVIVGGTIYYLLKARQPGFHKSTDDVLSHIIKVPAPPIA
jgi:hypothetical protein